MDLGFSMRHTIQTSPRHLRMIAVTAEERGFRSLWVPEHTVVPTEYESRYPYQPDARLPFPADTVYCDALGVLDHIAAVTETVRLSTSVIPIISRHPLALAKQAATVDLLSGGRLELGIGAGWLAEEATALGLPANKRGARLDETIEILRKAWTGRPFSHQGELWQIPEVVVSPAPAQGVDVPLWIGGGSPRAIRTIARSGFGAILPPGPPGVEMLPRIRAELPDAAKIAIPLAVSGTAPNDNLVERCTELRRAGADQIVIVSDADPQSALDTVREIDAAAVLAID